MLLVLQSSSIRSLNDLVSWHAGWKFHYIGDDSWCNDCGRYGWPIQQSCFYFRFSHDWEGNYENMGPIAVAICIPPIGFGLATFINKRKFSATEKETGKASFTMGYSVLQKERFLSLHKTHFVSSQVFNGFVVGSVIAMIFSVGDRVAHGGPIVAY